MGGVHAGEGGGELGAEGVFGFALCRDFFEGFGAALAREGLEELGEDAFAGFDAVELGGLEGWACDFFEAAADRGVSPGVGDVALAEQILGVEIAGAFGWFDFFRSHGLIGYAGDSGGCGAWNRWRLIYGVFSMGIGIRHVVVVSALLGVGAFVYVVGFEEMDEADHPRAAAINQSQSSQRLIAQIRRQIAGGRLENADRVTDQLYKHYGRGPSPQPEAFYWRALVDDLQGNPAAARTNWAILKAMLDEPDRWSGGYTSERLLYLRAWAMHGLGEVEEARGLFGTVADRLWIASEPKNGTGERTSLDLYNLACYRSMSGQLPEALEHWEKAVERGYGRGTQDETGWWAMDPDLEPLHALSAFWEIGGRISLGADGGELIADEPAGVEGGG